MFVHPRKLEKLKKRLQQIIRQENLQAHRDLLKQLSGELAIEPIDFASALLFASQPHLFANPPARDEAPLPPLSITPTRQRNVRYRLDVGSRHGITEDQLLATLIEESGVDRQRIERLDMRDSFTLVDLPDGMPADIFQLLGEATINGHSLNIKRIRRNRRKFREIKRNKD
jgi:hypothetical protein